VLQGAQRGGSLDALYQQHRLYSKPLQRAVQSAVKHYSAPVLADALSHAALIDRAIKGVALADAWQEFIKLGLKLAHGSKG
jgi:DNA polymerase-3 subunit delta